MNAITTRPVTFSNSCWRVRYPAGTVVDMHPEALEQGTRCVVARIPGRRYTAAVYVEFLAPA